MEREPVSKKTRFSVFKRDAFSCQYCGKQPPIVVLEVDHIMPVSKGGKSSIDNLITACFDCNRGKSGELLTFLPNTVIEKHLILAVKEEQIKAFDKLIKAKRKREDKNINDLELIFNEVYEGMQFTQSFRQSIRMFIQQLPFDELSEAMTIAIGKIKDCDKVTKYFCGICWHKIRAINP